MNVTNTVVDQVGRNEVLYRGRTPGSRALWERASRLMPNGVSAAIKYFPPYPVYLRSGSGGRVRDVDDNEYIDLVMGGGPHLLGHADPRLVEAAQAQVARLSQHLSPTEEEVRFAEQLQGYFPQLERVRLANTGSEAVRSAIRVARAMTGRTMVAKCEGLYHGSDDAVMISSTATKTAGPRERPIGVPDSAGIPPYVSEDTLVLPFNEPTAAAALIREHRQRLAAVLLEPIAFSSGGAIAADVRFAEALRAATSDAGAVLIFDEVVTGLRLGRGGAAQRLGVIPDLSCFGKAIGGGVPIAAFGGKAGLMEGALGLGAGASGRRIFQSGTFTANPVAMAVGSVVLRIVAEQDPTPRLDALAARLRRGLDEVFGQRGIPAHMTGAASIFQVHFTREAPRHRREVLAGDMAALHSFLLGLLTEGVFWTPVHPGLTCFAHTERDIEEVIAAAARVADRMS